MKTLPPTQEQEISSDNIETEEWLLTQVMALGEAFGESLTAERQAIYARSLADMPIDQLSYAIGRAIKELKWFPKVAEIRELARTQYGALEDGRPGPEEAWARMPKGEHAEEDSIVWCEEERAAYNACRSLLMSGDQIGARMAFKERYEKELAGARSQQKPVQWIMSAGFNIEHRLSTLAAAVQEKRMTIESALNFVPGERQNDFARMLPAPEAKGLLSGEVNKLPDLPGLAGILAKMRMEGNLPDELKDELNDELNADSRPPHRPSIKRSPEEWRELREKAKAQVEFLKRSRNGSGSGAA